MAGPAKSPPPLPPATRSQSVQPAGHGRQSIAPGGGCNHRNTATVSARAVAQGGSCDGGENGGYQCAPAARPTRPGTRRSGRRPAETADGSQAHGWKRRAERTPAARTSAPAAVALYHPAWQRQPASLASSPAAGQSRRQLSVPLPGRRQRSRRPRWHAFELRSWIGVEVMTRHLSFRSLEARDTYYLRPGFYNSLSFLWCLFSVVLGVYFGTYTTY